MEEQSPYKTARQTPDIAPRELRIGNLVCCHGRTVIVDNIVNNGINYSYPDEEPEYQFDNIQPIPLTEEILIKAGFELSSHFVWEHDKSGILFDQCEPGYEDRYSIRITTAYPYSDIVIRSLYLHDLQNKFFAIRGKELEIKL
jgi:hypothetical protein